MNTPDKRVEEIVGKFWRKCHGESVHEDGWIGIDGFSVEKAQDWLRTTLTQDRQQTADVLCALLEGEKKSNPPTHVCTDIGVTFVSDITENEICVHRAFIEEHNQALTLAQDIIRGTLSNKEL